MSYSEAVAYGKYVKYLIDLYRTEGMEELLRFLEYEDDFTAQQALAYMVAYHGNLKNDNQE